MFNKSSKPQNRIDSLTATGGVITSAGILLAAVFAVLGVLPFALYKLILWYAFRRFVVSARPLPNARLLFLRVFGSARRSERLFDLLAARWRYAGSVQVISGTDIARSRFEPDEFLDFIAGRFKTRYIENSADVAQRLAQIESRPDPDGRYRVHEFFCRADAWQETVTKLMQESELVVAMHWLDALKRKSGR